MEVHATFGEEKHETYQQMYGISFNSDVGDRRWQGLYLRACLDKLREAPAASSDVEAFGEEAVLFKEVAEVAADADGGDDGGQGVGALQGQHSLGGTPVPKLRRRRGGRRSRRARCLGVADAAAGAAVEELSCATTGAAKGRRGCPAARAAAGSCPLAWTVAWRSGGPLPPG